MSINWGPWAIGMTERKGVRRYLEHIGFQCLNGAEAIQLLQAVVHQDYRQILVMAMSWGTALEGLLGRLPLLRELRGHSTRRQQEWAHLEPEQSQLMPSPGSLKLREHLTKLAASLVGIEEELIDGDSSLIDLGLDSLGATVLVESVYRDFQVSLEAHDVSGISVENLIQMIGFRLEGQINSVPEVVPVVMATHQNESPLPAC